MDKTTIDNNAGSTRRQFKDAAQKALLAPENFNAYHFSYDHLQEAEDENDQKLWLVTFTDVIALMLTFFVLLYSM